MFREERGLQKGRSFHFRKMFDISIGKDVNNYVDEDGDIIEGEAIIHEETECRKDDDETEAFVVAQQITCALEKDKATLPPLNNNNNTKDCANNSKKERQISDMDLMKEKFSKLLLGEDMSGGGKGVSSALALSNAITNLAASVFGEQNKLEPMSSDRKARWKKEIDWLVSVTDYIVEFVPSQQKAKDGSNMEIMVTQQRRDLYLNIPALRKLDIMLLATLDNFVDEQEYKYVSKDADESEKGVQRDGKWWLPTVKVPPNGLSEESRQFLHKQKESVNQVLKASMAINAQILSDMEIPESYIDSLPKNGRSSLGESIYKSITVEFFDPMQFLSTMDMSSEHKVLDLKNRIEASIVIWQRKMNLKDAKSAWGSAVSLDKRELLEERAETILLLIKQQFPGIAQSSLEISKIQYNKDVGLSILESYSRVLESLANTVMSRIQDVLFADSVARDPSVALPTQKKLSRESEDSSTQTPTSRTLFDFMGGWESDPVDDPPPPPIRNSISTGSLDSYGGNKVNEDEEEEKVITKSPPNINIKKFSYMDKIDIFGSRSPTARH